MKKIALLTLPVLALLVTSCAAWVTGSEPLADKSLNDSQINAKIVDNQSTIDSVDVVVN